MLLPEQHACESGAVLLYERVLASEHAEHVEHRLARCVFGEVRIGLDARKKLRERGLELAHCRERAAVFDARSEVARVRARSLLERGDVIVSLYWE